MTPRCPECDIELDCTSERWVCPLCHQTPQPGQYVQHVQPVRHVPTTIPMRDLATELMEVLIEIVEEKPHFRPHLIDAYTLAKELAERSDQNAH